MTNQLYRSDLSIASPSEIERTAQQLTIMREEFLKTGTLALRTPRSMILESWQRCYTMHIDPAQRYASLAVARETQFRNLCEANELLLRAARPVMNQLAEFLTESGFVVVLSDANGFLLDMIGSTKIHRRLARVGFVPGGNWSETSVGTNAIGTAIADGHVVQLMAAEHYCDGWQDFTCTAAPIRHPLTDEIMGTLDVTGDYRLIRPFLTSSLATAALEVRKQLQTYLTTKSSRGHQSYLRGTLISFSRSASSSELNVNYKISQGHTKLLEVPPAIDIRLQLDRQMRKARDAQRLAAAGGAISASLDVSVTLEKVAEQLGYVLQIDDVAVCMFNKANDELSLSIWSKQKYHGPEALHILAPLLEKSKAVSLIKERGEPVFIDDVPTTTILSSTLIGQLGYLGIRSIALLPLTTARGTVGFIAAPCRTCERWDVDDIRLGQAFAVQAATAIENAMLFEKLQQHNRHMESLNAVTQLLNTLPDPSPYLDCVLERIAQVMHLDAGVILLGDKHADNLTLAARYGQSKQEYADLHEEPLRSIYQMAGLVVSTGESLLINNLKYDEHLVLEALHAIGLCYGMAVPLAANNLILGALLIGSRSACGLTEADLALFTTIGQQLGLALKNAQLQRSEREIEILREADRLKSGFLASVSHDLRSPLTAIRASVEGLLDRGKSQSYQCQEYLLHNIASQADRLGRLVDQLLDLSRIEAGALPLDCDWTELPALINDTIMKFEGLNQGCLVVRDLPSDLPLHYVDPDCLVQVLWNLLENAYKYAPASSPIEVEAYKQGNEVLIKVADRGPGVPVEEHEKIFQRFYRLDRGHKADLRGCGLGLAICRGIVEAHGGTIWVELRSGGGSVFCFTLPLPTTAPLDLEMSDEPILYDGSR